MKRAVPNNAPIRVRLPNKPLDVTPGVARVLLAILIEIHEVPVLDRRQGDDHES